MEAPPSKVSGKRKQDGLTTRLLTTSNQSRIESLEVNHQRPMKIPLEVKWNQGPQTRSKNIDGDTENA